MFITVVDKWLLLLLLIFYPLESQQSNSSWINKAMQVKTACEEDIKTTITSLMQCSNMKTVYLVHDESEDTCMWDIISGHTTVRWVLLHESVFEENIRQFVLNTRSSNNIDDMRSGLNFVILCSHQCITRSLRIGQEADMKFGQQSTLRHFSRWILVPTDVSIGCMSHTSIVFDNVVAVTYKARESPRVSTLFWKSSTSREWSGTPGEACNGLTLFPNRDLGLNGRRLQVVALHWEPFSVKMKGTPEPYYKGVSGELVDYLSKKLNFTYVYVEPPDLQWGTVLENSSWDGIVGMLEREEVDLCSVPYAYTPERARVMEYTYPTVVSFTTAIYKKYEDKNKVWKSLVSCFKWEVYVVGAGVLFGVVGGYVFLHRFSPRQYKSLKSTRDIWSFCFRILTVPLGQGTLASPSFCSGRVFFGFWSLFCIIMTSVYRGNLIAFLTVDKVVVPFTTLNELANQNEFDIGTHRGNVISQTLETSNISTYQKLWKKIAATQDISPPGFSSDNEYLLRRLEEGHFVLVDSKVITDIMQSKECGLETLKEEFMHTRSSIVFPLHSPLAKLFHREILATVENGLYEKWYAAWVPKRLSCENSDLSVGVSPLGIQEYFSAVVACGVGVFGALTVLLMEVLLFTFSGCKKNNKFEK